MNKQRLKQKLKTNLTPQQIQFLSLLQLPIGILEKRIEEELEENPAIEEVEEEEDHPLFDSVIDDLEGKLLK